MPFMDRYEASFMSPSPHSRQQLLTCKIRKGSIEVRPADLVLGAANVAVPCGSVSNWLMLVCQPLPVENSVEG